MMGLSSISSALDSFHLGCITKRCNTELWDEAGQRYINFISGIGVLNLNADTQR